MQLSAGKSNVTWSVQALESQFAHANSAAVCIKYYAPGYTTHKIPVLQLAAKAILQEKGNRFSSGSEGSVLLPSPGKASLASSRRDCMLWKHCKDVISFKKISPLSSRLVSRPSGLAAVYNLVKRLPQTSGRTTCLLPLMQS